MKKKRRGLGRGLSALIGDAALDAPNETGGDNETGQASKTGGVQIIPDTKNATTLKGFQWLGTDQLKPGAGQPRQEFPEEALQELASSLKEKGVLQPLLVRPAGGESGSYEIVAGERRWRAAQIAGLHELPVIVRPLSDAEALEIGIIENVQRMDLNPIEEAQAFRRLMDEFGYTQTTLSKVLGKSRSHIANILRLNSASELIRGFLTDGSMVLGHARAVLAHDNADALAQKIVDEGLTVRAVEKMLAKKDNDDDDTFSGGSGRSYSAKDANTRALERTLEEQLGLKTNITHRGEGGALTISYKSLEQLDDIVRRLVLNAPEL